MSALAPSESVPALRFMWLTKYYDIIVSVTIREATLKAALIAREAIRSGQPMDDLGCGTGTAAIRAKTL
ncbi:MAG: hypothetical protein ACPHUF_13405 [Gammaproteobacteria bacterium]